jgi:phospholipase A1
MSTNNNTPRRDVHIKRLSRKKGVMLTLLLTQPFISISGSPLTDCLLDQLKHAQGNVPVATLRQTCEDKNRQFDSSRHHLVPSRSEKKNKERSAVKSRLDNELQAIDNPFAITPHKPNYFLPLTYPSHPNETPFSEPNGTLRPLEMKFQLSIKFPVAKNVLFNNSRLFFAYTNLSFWQAYNSRISSPFRETNHEPEVFLLIPQHRSFLGWDHHLITIGFNHQSNGQTGTLSRSWNRIYTNFVFERKNLVLSIKPWYRIPETGKKDINDAAGDDNPDIEHFMGHGELRALYTKNVTTQP